MLLPRSVIEAVGVGEGDYLTLLESAAGEITLSVFDPEVEKQIQAMEKVNARYRNALKALADR